MFHKLEVVTRDGLKLHAWRKAHDSKLKANILIIHGLKDHSERYHDFAIHLASNGYQVFSYDLRGHARSEGDEVYISDFTALVSDLKIAFDSFRIFDEEKPWIFFGHCLGGSIVARFAASVENNIAGFIMSGPFLKRAPELTSSVLSSLKIVDKFVPHFQIYDLPDDIFSRDPQVIKSIQADPFIYHRKIPVRTLFSILDNIEFIQENKSKIKRPFLILHGAGDEINNSEGSRDFFSATPNIPGKDIKIYPILRHDLLHEPEHSRVEQDIINWVNKITSSPAFTHASDAFQAC